MACFQLAIEKRNVHYLFFDLHFGLTGTDVEPEKSDVKDIRQIHSYALTNTDESHSTHDLY
jgi:hypothetical protein